MGDIDMSTADNVAAVKAAYEAYGQGNDLLVDELFSDNVEISGPTATGAFKNLGWKGPAGFVGFVAQIREEWDHKLYEALSIEGAGDWVVSLVHVVTVHRSSRKQLDTTMAHALRFKDGKCVEFHEHIDRGSMASAAAP
jgi:ketosteroid isomerase-like protein